MLKIQTKIIILGKKKDVNIVHLIKLVQFYTEYSRRIARTNNESKLETSGFIGLCNLGSLFQGIF